MNEKRINSEITESKNVEKINIEVEINTERNVEMWKFVKEYFGETPLSILEIGVFKAGQIRVAHKFCNVKSYVGVDPYMGTKDDTYTGSYWKDTNSAFQIYKNSSGIFRKFGGAELYRCTSEMYYKNLEGDEKWDVIFVDANHRYWPALSDMCHWFKKLRIGGCLLVDDYANSDTPQVTPAVNHFLEMFCDSIKFVETTEKWFKNKGKHIPICTKRIHIYKNDEMVNRKLYIGKRNESSDNFFKRWKDVGNFEGYFDLSAKNSEAWNGLDCVGLDTIMHSEGVLLIPNDAYGELEGYLHQNGYIEGFTSGGFVRQEVFEIAYFDEWKM